MKGIGTVVAVGLVLAVGCGGDSAATPTASSIAPNDMPDCAEIYTEGAEIDNENFGLACVQGEDLISPRPVRIECSDGRELLFNDLAWGYFGEPMTITPEDDPSKMPQEAVDECLEPAAPGTEIETED